MRYRFGKEVNNVGKQIAGFTVNGKLYEAMVEPHATLLEVLRDQLDLTGTKHSCGMGICGACTVLVDGQPVLSCLTLAMAVKDKRIVTIEGLCEGNVSPHSKSLR